MGDNICGGPLTLSSRNPLVLQEEAGKVREDEIRCFGSGHAGPYLFECPPTKAITALDHLKKRGSAKKQKNKGSEEKKVSWRDLLAFDDVIKDLRIRVEKYVEMKSRNKKVVVVYEYICYYR
uniref:Uncharacterized protein n=1 Tax=Populus alba TaxID=43335 RepID=A0A4U5PZH5_POPAL|nr:hypothetical protein D5086_0000175580 [Populus alba]